MQAFAIFLPTLFIFVFDPTASVPVANFKFFSQILTAQGPPITRRIFLGTYCLMSNTYFNATIVCSTDSRASVILHTYHAFCFLSLAKTINCQLRLPFPTLPPIFMAMSPSFCSPVNFFVQFFKNWRNSANWRAKCTPDICLLLL